MANTYLRGALNWYVRANGPYGSEQEVADAWMAVRDAKRLLQLTVVPTLETLQTPQDQQQLIREPLAIS